MGTRFFCQSSRTPSSSAGLIGVAAHLFVQLDDAFAQLRFLSILGLAAQLEQLALAGDHASDLRLAGGLQKLVRELDGVGAVTFRVQPGASREQFGQALVDHRQVRLCRRFIEPDKKLARLHPRPVMDQEVAHDPAGRVLNLLHVGFHHQGARRDHGSRKVSGCADHAHAADQENGGRADRNEVRPDRLLRLAGSAHDDLLPRATFSPAANPGCLSCWRTCSLAPNACTRPSLSTST